MLFSPPGSIKSLPNPQVSPSKWEDLRYQHDNESTWESLEHEFFVSSDCVF